jgi:Transposase
MRGRGRNRKATANLDRMIQRKVKANRRKTASAVKYEIEEEMGVIIHANTVRNRLHEIGFYGRVARKKPYVNKCNRAKRIHYSKTMLGKPFDYWGLVLWPDESKFNLFGSDGKVMVWRSPKEECEPRCTVPTVKHGGGSVMVWGCFSRCGVGNLHFVEGNMDRFGYREILEKNLK